MVLAATACTAGYFSSHSSASMANVVDGSGLLGFGLSTEASPSASFA